MRVQELDLVTLTRDLPAHGLVAGDVGTVVFVYEPTGLEVEFAATAERDTAVVTLEDADVRPRHDGDRPAVPRTSPAPVH